MVVRVRLPKATAAGQHVLIANDEPYPRPIGEYGYSVARALLSVVDPELAAGRPAVETVIDFDPPVRFPAVREQLWVMGAQLLRIHHGGGAGGEFFTSPDEPFPNFLGRAEPVLAPAMVDSITIKGQVEVASLGPIAGHASARRVSSCRRRPPGRWHLPSTMTTVCRSVLQPSPLSPSSSPAPPQCWRGAVTRNRGARRRRTPPSATPGRQPPPACAAPRRRRGLTA